MCVEGIFIIASQIKQCKSHEVWGLAVSCSNSGLDILTGLGCLVAIFSIMVSKKHSAEPSKVLSGTMLLWAGVLSTKTPANNPCFALFPCRMSEEVTVASF